MRGDRRATRLSAGLRRRHRDESGAIAIIAGALVVALLLSAALAVDVGRVASTSRDLQGATDRAALDALDALRAEHAGGSVTEALHTAVADSVEESLSRNGFGEGSIEDWQAPDVVIGHTPAGSNAFHPLYPDGDATAPSSIPNAVQVSTSGFQPFLLAIGDEEGGRQIDKHAVAASDAVATISAATTTLGVEDGLLKLLVETLIPGSELDLDVLSSEGVVSGTVDLRLLAADLGVASVEELLDAELSLLELWESAVAVADLAVFEGGGDTLGARLEALGISGVGRDWLEDFQVSLGELLDIDTSGQEGASIGASLTALLSASLQAATATGDPDASCGTNGDALRLDASALENLLGAEDGVDLVEVCLNLIDPPVLASGPAAPRADYEPEGDLSREDYPVDAWTTVAETAQIDLSVALDLGTLNDNTGLVGDLLDAVADLIGDVLDGLGDALECIFTWNCDFDDVDYTLGEVTVGVDAAKGSAALTEVSCGDPGHVRTRNSVTVGGVSIAGELLSVEGEEEDADGDLDVDPDDAGVGAGLGDSVSDARLEGPYPTDAVTVPEDGTPPELSLELDDLTGTGVLDPALEGLNTVINGLLTPLNSLLLGDSGLVSLLLDALGIDLGTMDVRAHDVDCGARRLLPLGAG